MRSELDVLPPVTLDFQDLDVASVRVDGRQADFTQVEAAPDISDNPNVTQPMKLVVEPHPSTRPKAGRDFTVQVRYSGAPQPITDPDTSIEGWIRACYPLAERACWSRYCRALHCPRTGSTPPLRSSVPGRAAKSSPRRSDRR